VRRSGAAGALLAGLSPHPDGSLNAQVEDEVEDATSYQFTPPPTFVAKSIFGRRGGLDVAELPPAVRDAPGPEPASPAPPAPVPRRSAA
jgi:hypothetical protein